MKVKVEPSDMSACHQLPKIRIVGSLGKKEHYCEVHKWEEEGWNLAQWQVAERKSSVCQRALDKENGRPGEVGPRLTEREQGGSNMDEERQVVRKESRRTWCRENLSWLDSLSQSRKNNHKTL